MRVLTGVLISKRQIYPCFSRRINLKRTDICVFFNRCVNLKRDRFIRVFHCRN